MWSRLETADLIGWLSMKPIWDSADWLPESLAAEAKRMAALIADRLADDDVVAEAVQRSVTVSPDLFGWGGPSLYGGHVGSALLFRYAAMHLGDPGPWRRLSRRHLQTAARYTLEQAMLLPSLSGGTAGLTLAVNDICDDQPKYLPMLHRLQQSLAEQVMARPQWRPDDGVNPGYYDVISGAAGVLGYLVSIANPGPGARRSCQRLIDDLVWMTSPSNHRDRPVWYVPPRFDRRPEILDLYPNGYVDVGFAHGLAGPLAALSMAWTAGYRRPGMRDSIAHVAAFLRDLRLIDEFGVYWPQMLALNPDLSLASERLGANTMSWCYGAPGVSSSLLDASEALSDPALRTLAVGGLEAAVKRATRGYGGPRNASLCHGWSGLLAIYTKFAKRRLLTKPQAGFIELTERVLAHCDPQHLLVVQESMQRDGTHLHLDSPNLLDGAAGVPLALWSVTAPTMSTRWQRALVIA